MNEYIDSQGNAAFCSYFLSILDEMYNMSILSLECNINSFLKHLPDTF